MINLCFHEYIQFVNVCIKKNGRVYAMNLVLLLIPTYHVFVQLHVVF